MFELVYTSRASSMMTEIELEELRNEAIYFNSMQQITGLLLYNNGIFLQLLEGEQHDVESLYSRIKQDFRHYDVRQIYSRPIDQRSFSSWSMRFINVSPHLRQSSHNILLKDKLDLTEDWILPNTAKMLIKAFQHL
ncbi:blue light sensor protein [Thiomicrospira aerophila AL3]|uniref:Blue light sensor protein n=1 Tax=Thiomicrospira aerophila AL3 TaxID=717772 RepID=W0DUW2_9GAMM|nr:BLUF domain-containing protein [Thiomicrospira aerophila]AHF00774.1 blue light sensor protein [Thiomicrospira aerophila AL3]